MLLSLLHGTIQVYPVWSMMLDPPWNEMQLYLPTHRDPRKPELSTWSLVALKTWCSFFLLPQHKSIEAIALKPQLPIDVRAGACSFTLCFCIEKISYKASLIFQC